MGLAFFPFDSLFVYILLIIGVIILVVVRYKHKSAADLTEVERKERIFRFRILMSEWYMLFSMLFLFSAMFALQRELRASFDALTLFLILIGISFVVAYRFALRFTLLFSITAFVVWWVIQAGKWLPLMPLEASTSSAIFSETYAIRQAAVITGIFLLGIVWYLLGYIHQTFLTNKKFSGVYTCAGILIVLGWFFTFSQRGGLQMLEDATRGESILKSPYLVVSLSVITAVAIGLLLFAWKQRMIIFYEFLALFVLLSISLSLLFVPQLHLFSMAGDYYSVPRELTTQGFLYALFFNASLFFSILGTIFSGYIRKEVWRINAGAALMVLFILMKYFDWFFTFMDKGVFFIVAGFILFAVGFGMERGRRMLIAAAQVEKNKE